MTTVLSIGLSAALLMLAILIWSICIPERRLWPPMRTSTTKKIGIWLLTLIIFSCAFFLGYADWNGLEWPTLIRWGIGLPMIVFGNAIVWTGVAQIGLAATSGEVSKLQTRGLYRYSRNPQYVADMSILIGWFILSATVWVVPVVVLGVAMLVIASFAEEQWLTNFYRAEYVTYRSKVPRFF